MEKQEKRINASPSPLVRWLAWLLLGALSVFFAEVSAGRSPLVFFDVTGLLVTVPLYVLHMLVLAPLALRNGIRPGLSTLFLAGAIFGLYEAYITKVLWSPPWNPEAWRLGGVAVLDTIVLALFWHPFMAFIIPLFVGSRLFGDESFLKIYLPSKWSTRLKPYWLAASGALLGFLHGAAIGNLSIALFSAILSALIIVLLAALWQQVSHGLSFKLADLLPNHREWRTLALLLLADYLVLGLVLRQDAMPLLTGQFSIWLLYGLFGGLLWLSRRTDKKAALNQKDRTPVSGAYRFNLASWLWFALGFILLSALSSLLVHYTGNTIYLLVWIVLIPAVLFGLARAIFHLLKSRGKQHVKQSPGSHSPYPS